MDKLLKLIIWPLLIAPVIYLAITWNLLPEKIAINFDLNGHPNKYGSKNELWIYILILTAVSTVIYIFLPMAYKIDPRKTAVENKTRLKRLAFAIAVFMSFVACIIINTAIKGHIRMNMRLVFGSMGLLWCILGNYMYNIKPNYFAGLRLPWTLANEENWKRTHWLAGKLWFAGGLLIVLVSLLLPKSFLIVVTIIITIVVSLIPGIYSYKLYRKQKTHIEN